MRLMRYVLMPVLVAALPAWAQTKPDDSAVEYKWNAHGYFAGGSSMGDNNAGYAGGGGGFEAFVWKRVTVGGDVSVFRDNYYTAVGTFGHIGAQVGYHFASRDKTRGADPFVIFGVGGYFPEESSAAVHGGGGLNYWFHRRIGVRFEFRVAGRPYGDNIDGVFRAGIAFR